MNKINCIILVFILSCNYARASNTTKPTNSTANTSLKEKCTYRQGKIVKNLCFFKITDKLYNFSEAESTCKTYDSNLAILNDVKIYNFLIRRLKYDLAFGQLNTYWFDGEIKNGIFQTKNGSPIKVSRYWRYFFPRPELFRSKVVLDVWNEDISDYKSLQGFRNVPEEYMSYILCQFEVI